MVGQFFFDKTADTAQLKAMFEKVIENSNFNLIGWREVPVDE